MIDGIRLLCLGSATPASSLVPVAVNIVNRLREVDQFGYKQVIGETWRIDVKLSNGHAVVTIWEDESSGGGKCPDYMSGMTQFGFNAFRYDNTTGSRINRFFSFSPTTQYASDHGLSLGWGFGPYTLAPHSELSGAPAVDPSALGKQPVPWNAYEWTQAAYLKASLYSGYMRYVVQILLGSKIQVKYGYTFAKTHGVLRRNDGKRQADWLIEISAENGVLAMKMPACRQTIPKGNALGYTPTGDTFPTGDALTNAINSGTVKRLLRADDLSPVYEKSPFSGMFGWAFSYDGSSASVVVSDRVGRFVNTYLYTVSISPDSASLALEESDRVAWQGYDLEGYATSTFKAPTVPGGSCVPVDLGDVSGDDALIECNAPLHVFYRIDGRRTTVRFRNGPFVSQRPTDERRRPRPSGIGEYDDMADENWAGILSNVNVDFVEYGPPESINANYWQRINQQIYVSDNPPDVDRHTPLRKTYKSMITSSNVYILNLTGTGFLPVMLSTAKRLVRAFQSSQSNYTQTVRTSVVASSFDREVVASHISTSTLHEAKTDRYSTYNGTEAAARYYGNGIDGVTITFRGDGMPIGAQYLVDGTPPSGSSGIIEINGAFMGSGWGVSYNGTSTAARGDFGGFGGAGNAFSFESAFVSPPPGFGLISETDGRLAGFLPLSSSMSKYNVYGRTTKKTGFYGTYVVGMPNLTSSPADEFTDQPSTYNPDGAWFSFAPVTFAGFGSWNSSLRFSPPQLNSYDYALSVFGQHSTPDTSHPLLLNFIGDA